MQKARTFFWRTETSPVVASCEQIKVSSIILVTMLARVRVDVPAISDHWLLLKSAFSMTW